MLELRLGMGNNDAIARLIGVIDSFDVRQIWPEVVKETIYPFVLNYTKKNFQMQGRLGGQSWNYNTEPQYSAYKFAMTGHREVLRWEKGGKYEKLYPSLTQPGHEFHHFVMTPLGVQVGSTLPYAASLASGGINPFGEPYPGRNPMRMGMGTRKQLISTIRDHIRRHLP